MQKYFHFITKANYMNMTIRSWTEFQWALQTWIGGKLNKWSKISDIQMLNNKSKSCFYSSVLSSTATLLSLCTSVQYLSFIFISPYCYTTIPTYGYTVLRISLLHWNILVALFKRAAVVLAIVLSSWWERDPEGVEGRSTNALNLPNSSSSCKQEGEMQ